MTSRPNPFLNFIVLASVVVGIALSLLDWGKPGGVHGQGWPIPSEINGLPDDAPELLKDISDLGMVATISNGVLALLAGLLIWALFVLISRIKP